MELNYVETSRILPSLCQNFDILFVRARACMLYLCDDKHTTEPTRWMNRWYTNKASLKQHFIIQLYQD